MATATGKFTQSDRWTALQAQGYTRIVFACDHGQERSCAYAEASCDRAEPAVFVDGGMWGIWKKANHEIEACKQWLLKKYDVQHDAFVVIIDGPSNPAGFLVSLKAAGFHHIVLTSGQLKEELVQAGQMWIDYF